MAETLRVRCIFPDGWLESRLEAPADTSLEELKRRALQAMFQSDSVDARAFYVEFREKEIWEESVTLRELGVTDGAVVSIRRHDLHHPPPYRG